MSDKDGEFDGEYEFYEDDSDDLEDNSSDEDEHEQFLSARQQELNTQQNAFIKNKGYVEKFPNISLSDVIEGEYITFLSESESKSQMLSQEELELWKKGNLKIDKNLDEVIKKWYPRGTYRIFRQIDNLRSKYNAEQDFEKSLKIKENIESLFFEKMPAAKKFELSEAYGICGEQLTDLYLAIYGRDDEKKIDLGFFNAFVPVMFYKDEMKLKSSKKPNFYFKDFKKAHDFLYSLKGDYVVGSLTNEIFEDIGGYALGEAVIRIGDAWIDINSTIVRKEWLKERECSSIVGPIQLKRKEFLYWLKKNHPEFETMMTEYRSVFFYYKDEIEGEYYKSSSDGFDLEIYASVEVQEQMIKDLLEYSTGNDLSDKGL